MFNILHIKRKLKYESKEKHRKSNNSRMLEEPRGFGIPDGTAEIE
jgi:hypothetical protein